MDPTILLLLTTDEVDFHFFYAYCPAPITLLGSMPSYMLRPSSVFHSLKSFEFIGVSSLSYGPSFYLVDMPLIRYSMCPIGLDA